MLISSISSTRPSGSNKPSFFRKICDSTTARVIGLVSGVSGVGRLTLSILMLLGLGSFNHPAGIKVGVHASVPRPPAGSTTAPLTRSPDFTVQSSLGSQSPNVNRVQRDVEIQYGSASDVPKELSKQTSPVARAFFAPTNSTIQTSVGVQSPNVNGVAGNVDLRYAYPAAALPGVTK